MKDEIIKINSIGELHQLNGLDQPKHPLISIIDMSEVEVVKEYLSIRTSLNMYVIGLKDASCGNQYGRNGFDFDSGVLFFTSPHQVQTITKAHAIGEVHGWMIIFHPDLIRNTPLGKVINRYNFFSYSVHEALHLSEPEENTLTECMNIIKKEISQRIDNHSQTVISSTLELLLNLSMRYYERQFNTRSSQNSDIVSQFEQELKSYYDRGQFSVEGIPTVESLSKNLHLSASYLSDLLKKTTGQNAKEQINSFVIDKAKTILLNSTESISEIAYELGFNYPHYFSRLFKVKTGKTPKEYRQMN